jgi:hypothetical protein
MPGTIEKPLQNRYFFVIKIFKKVLDKGGWLWYYSRARPNESAGMSEANLENDTERNAQEIQRRFQRV